MNPRRDYKLVPIAPLVERVATRRADEKLVEITVVVPEDNAQEITEIAGVMRSDAGFFESSDLVY
jgi:hypothetical protein